MYENWAELSQKSRLELLKGEKRDFERIVHSENWKKYLKDVLDQKIKTVNMSLQMESEHLRSY